MTLPTPAEIEAAKRNLERILESASKLDATTFLSPSLNDLQTLLASHEQLEAVLVKMAEERDCWITNANNLQDGYNKLEAELKKEKGRLDWLEENQADIMVKQKLKTEGEHWWNITDIDSYETVRTCIDAAIAQSKGKESEG